MNVSLFLPRLTDTESNNITLIAVDIGGTKTNFGLYKSNNQKVELLKEGTYASQEYSSFSDVVKMFISENQIAGVDRISIGVAGPVLDGKVHTTNLPWEIDKRILLQDIGVKEVGLINDLEATAYGLNNIHEEYLATIYPGADDAKGNIAILAPGTGLGEAAMYWDGKAYRPFATEGGHSEFSPRSEQDIELYHYLKNEFGIVSWEHLISGPGIYNIYKFLRDVKGEKEPVWLTERLAQEDPSMVISHTAIRELNATCVHTMNLFVHYMAREATSLVLKTKATGGLFLGGGIPPKIYPLLRNDLFHQQFVESDRMENLLKNIPIRLILNSKTALIGAAYYGAFGATE